ncbi:MAG: pilus assembly protein, partial [Planctomycetales bacterium]|nr:pilus assembly protein [Planctomycetales bacterium]
VVETAIALPLLVFIVFASIESCNAIFLKQTAASAAYEAAKIASNTGGTQLAANTRATEVLMARGITNATVTFDPALQENWGRGVMLSTTVSIPTTNNLGGTNFLFRGQPVSVKTVMVKQ